MPYTTIISVSATLLSGVLTLIITRIFDERREKRAASERVFYQLLPERQKLYDGIITAFSVEHINDVCDNPDNFIFGDSKFYKFCEEITSLMQRSVFFGSRNITTELIKTSLFLVNAQLKIQVRECITEDDICVFRKSFEPYADSVNLLLREESYADIIDSFTENILNENKKAIKKIWEKGKKIKK
jgi:hypothetical protein